MGLDRPVPGRAMGSLLNAEGGTGLEPRWPSKILELRGAKGIWPGSPVTTQPTISTVIILRSGLVVPKM